MTTTMYVCPQLFVPKENNARQLKEKLIAPIQVWMRFQQGTTIYQSLFRKFSAELEDAVTVWDGSSLCFCGLSIVEAYAIHRGETMRNGLCGWELTLTPKCEDDQAFRIALRLLSDTITMEQNARIARVEKLLAAKTDGSEHFKALGDFILKTVKALPTAMYERQVTISDEMVRARMRNKVSSWNPEDLFDKASPDWRSVQLQLTHFLKAFPDPKTTAFLKSFGALFLIDSEIAETLDLRERLVDQEASAWGMYKAGFSGLQPIDWLPLVDLLTEYAALQTLTGLDKAKAVMKLIAEHNPIRFKDLYLSTMTPSSIFKENADFSKVPDLYF